jgi:hypothetical protein
MNNSYVIQWKSKVNGRAGRGTKRFEKDEVEQLIEELNREYPQIKHEAVAVSAAESELVAEPAIPNVSIPVFSPA